MDVTEVLAQARDAMAVRRVVGDPVERDGVTVIPVVRIRGGGGGGDDGMSRDGKPQPAGGGGFGLVAVPVGAYVIQDGRVRWEPALDLTRVIVGGQLLTLAGLLVLRSFVRKRRR